MKVTDNQRLGNSINLNPDGEQDRVYFVDSYSVIKIRVTMSTLESIYLFFLEERGFIGSSSTGNDPSDKETSGRDWRLNELKIYLWN